MSSRTVHISAVHVLVNASGKNSSAAGPSFHSDDSGVCWLSCEGSVTSGALSPTFNPMLPPDSGLSSTKRSNSPTQKHLRDSLPSRALSLALRAGPSPKTAWGRDLGSLRSRLLSAGLHRPRAESSPRADASLRSRLPVVVAVASAALPSGGSRRW